MGKQTDIVNHSTQNQIVGYLKNAVTKYWTFDYNACSVYAKLTFTQLFGR